MIGWAFYATHIAHLRALCLAVFASLHATTPDAPAIADAIANAVAADAEPVFGDADTEAAVAAVYVVAESGARLHPHPYSWDARAGLAVGAFQIHGPAGRQSVDAQAREWVRLLRAGAESCPANPLAPVVGRCGGLAMRLANRRVREAERLLESMTEKETASE